MSAMSSANCLRVKYLSLCPRCTLTFMAWMSVSIPLWMRVFYWATYSSARNVRQLLDVPLFDGQYLFEDLRIRHGKHTLADVFERSQQDCTHTLGKGRHVVRIVLPTSQMSMVYGHSRHWADEVTNRIIKYCPNFLVLSRYHRIPVKDPKDITEPESELHSNRSDENGECCFIHDPPLPSLRRLDWFNGCFGDAFWSPIICAVPSSLWSAQGIESLSLSGDNYFWGPAELQSLTGQIVLLPNVRTLRVGSIHAFGVPGVSGYTLALPSLRRITLDRGEALHRLMESVIAFPTSSPNGGPKAKILEVGSPHWRFTRSDYVSTLIRHYPTAESLYYPVFFVRPLRWRRLQNNGLSYGPSEPGKVFPSLRHVGLHGERDPELSYQELLDKMEAVWSHLHAHCRTLLGCTGPNLIESRLPNICSITLYGSAWLPLIDDPRFHVILDLAQRRGAGIHGEHAGVANALELAIFEYETSLLLDWIYVL